MAIRPILQENDYIMLQSGRDECVVLTMVGSGNVVQASFYGYRKHFNPTKFFELSVEMVWLKTTTTLRVKPVESSCWYICHDILTKT